MPSEARRLSAVPPAAVVRAVNNAQRAVMRFTRKLTPARFVLLDLVTSRWISDAILVVTRLGVPETLEHGPKSVADIARAVGADEHALYRVMRALARERVFKEQPQRTFELNDLSRPLLRSDPGSMRNMVGMIGASWLQRVWARLEDSVRTGDEIFTKVHHGKDLWSYLAENKEDREEFDRAMAETAREVVHTVASCYDFSRFATVVDVGGGVGELLSGILQRYPSVRGVLYDMVQPISLAPAVLARHGVADRVEIIEGNHLEWVPKGKDAYVLKSILHGRSDEVSRGLIARCADAMNPGGRVLLIEMVVPEEGAYMPFFDLQLLILSHGRCRTRSEFAALFSGAGMQLEEVVDLPGPASILVGKRAR